MQQSELAYQARPPARPGSRWEFDICGSPSRKLRNVSRQAHAKEISHDGRILAFKSYEVGVQIPRSHHSRRPGQDAVRAIAKAPEEVFRRLAQTEGEPDRRAAPDERPCAHDDRDSAEVSGVPGCRVHQGEECDSPGTGLRRAKAEFRSATLLGAGILRVDGREGRGGDPTAGEGGQTTGSTEPGMLTGHRSVGQGRTGPR